MNPNILNWLFTGVVVLSVVENVPPVRLADAVARPDRYDRTLVQVVGEFQIPAEGPWYFCAIGCAQSVSMDDLVLFHVPMGFTDEVALTRLKAAGQRARQVRVSAIGRFEACETPCWGFPARFRFRLVVAKILRIDASDAQSNRDRR